MNQISIKYANTVARPPKIYPNLDFWFEKIPSGNPGIYTNCDFCNMRPLIADATNDKNRIDPYFSPVADVKRHENHCLCKQTLLQQVERLQLLLGGRGLLFHFLITHNDNAYDNSTAMYL
jgi:hypothetical protein